MIDVLMVVRYEATRLIMNRRLRKMYAGPSVQCQEDVPIWVITPAASLMGHTFSLIIVAFDPDDIENETERERTKDFLTEYLPTKLEVGGIMMKGTIE